jgi:hypothetical protein
MDLGRILMDRKLINTEVQGEIAMMRKSDKALQPRIALERSLFRMENRERKYFLKIPEWLLCP